MWHVHLIINETENRTTSDDIANFLNQCELDGLRLVAATGGFLFFQETEQAVHTSAVENDFPAEEDVLYESVEPEEPSPPRRPRASSGCRISTRQPPSRPSVPDPSIRPGGSDLDLRTSRPQGMVTVDPRLLQGYQQQSVAPQSSTPLPNDPYGLGN